MRATDYQNEQSKSFKKAVAWLNQNRKLINRLAGLPNFDRVFGESNWGMPVSIYKNLTDDQIGWLAAQTQDWCLNKTTTALDDISFPISVKSILSFAV